MGIWWKGLFVLNMDRIIICTVWNQGREKIPLINVKSSKKKQNI